MEPFNGKEYVINVDEKGLKKAEKDAKRLDKLWERFVKKNNIKGQFIAWYRRNAQADTESLARELEQQLQKMDQQNGVSAWVQSNNVESRIQGIVNQLDSGVTVTNNLEVVDELIAEEKPITEDQVLVYTSFGVLAMVGLAILTNKMTSSNDKFSQHIEFEVQNDDEAPRKYSSKNGIKTTLNKILSKNSNAQTKANLI